jgi:hypothetical protein
MKLQRYLGIAILFVALSFSKVKAQTVYITESGKKYHAKNCSLVKTGKKGIDLKEAQKEGYEPCKFCKADAIENKEKNKKSSGKS